MISLGEKEEVWNTNLYFILFFEYKSLKQLNSTEKRMLFKDTEKPHVENQVCIVSDA